MRPPLNRMKIRTAESDESISGTPVSSRLSSAASPIGGTFGKVRSSRTKAHQGWDLYADVGTPVYAVEAGVVEYTDNLGPYGVQVCIRLNERAMTPAARRSSQQRYAFYAHLSLSFVRAGQAVLEAEVIGLSGNSGNAENTPPHLHFEFRSTVRPGLGLGGRLDPGELLGYGYYSSK